MVILRLGFVHSPSSSLRLVLQPKTTCRELNMPSFHLFTNGAFLCTIPDRYKVAFRELVIARSNINLNTTQVFTYKHVYV